MRKGRFARWLSFFFCAVLCCAMLPAAGATNQAPAALTDHFVTGELLVKFREPLVTTTRGAAPQAASPSLETLLRRQRVSAAEPLAGDAAAAAAGLNRLYRLTIPPQQDVLATVGAFLADPGVEYAEPNYLFSLDQTTLATPNDPSYSALWGLNNTGQTGGTPDADIDAAEAWDITTGANNLLIAVVDTGVDYTHPELDDGRVRTDIDYDFANNDADAMDDNRHGTHVAGTIAAEANNNLGITGVMWQSQILPVKVLTAEGFGSIFMISQGITYAASQGARVISMSLGGLICTQAMADAVNYAFFTKGAVVVAATGNNNGALSYPAKFGPVIAVAASDHTDQRAGFSNYGPEVDVAAPGVAVLSTVPGGGFATFSGTSMATPHVAGVAGLLLAQRPALTNLQVTEILRNSADDRGLAGFDPFFGFGRVNAYVALLTATPPPPPPPSPIVCDCAVTNATADDPGRAATLQLLWQLQSQVLLASPRGRELNDAYYRHSAELSMLLLRDAGLRDMTLATLADLAPLFRALTGEGPEVTVSAAMVTQVKALAEAIALQAGPELQAELATRWHQAAPEQLVGLPASEAWARINRSGSVYLPLVNQ